MSESMLTAADCLHVMVVGCVRALTPDFLLVTVIRTTLHTQLVSYCLALTVTLFFSVFSQSALRRRVGVVKGLLLRWSNQDLYATGCERESENEHENRSWC